MAIAAHQVAVEVETRARQSQGSSDVAIYGMVARALEERYETRSGALLDVGCGTGQLWPYLQHLFLRYVGIDAVHYGDFPSDAEFHKADLDTGSTSLPNGIADVVASVETIEHLENPRAFVRELVRLVKPGGWVIVTTPNQLSLLSLLTLAIKKRFSAFQEVHYPAHLTALLEVDLKRIAAECGLSEVSLAYSLAGRIVMTPWHYPRFLSRLFPRALSDNVLVVGRKQYG
jgi:2-polyprenyl-3-methyl-5-hydroxy-6-metoxy-1,4-benzoquinol methylase